MVSDTVTYSTNYDYFTKEIGPRLLHILPYLVMINSLMKEVPTCYKSGLLRIISPAPHAVGSII